jgi:hypothetical protein
MFVMLARVWQQWAGTSWAYLPETFSQSIDTCFKKLAVIFDHAHYASMMFIQIIYIT